MTGRRCVEKVLTSDMPLWDKWVAYKAGDFCDEAEYEALKMAVYPLEYGHWNTTEADKVARELADKLAAIHEGRCSACRRLG